MNLDFQCFDQQANFVDDQSIYPAAVCGIGGGKTEGGAIKALLKCMENPGILGMVTAPTFRMLEDATIRTLQKVIPDGLYTYHKGEMRMEFRNHSEILLRSTDDPERLRGPNLGFVWMDEAALSPRESFRILQGRIRQPGMPHQLWITTTPKGFNWVYQEFGAMRRDGYNLHTWPTIANPYLPDYYAKQLRDSYPGNFGLQELEAQFVITDGVAFFDADVLSDMLGDTEEPKDVRDGSISIWRQPLVGGRYVGGADISWGETGAFSCYTICDYQTGAEMAEIYGRIPEAEFAQSIFDLSTEYNHAFTGIEDNGEGINVVNRCLTLGMAPWMFHRESRQPRSGLITTRTPRVPGWHTDLNTRPIMLSEYAEAIRYRATIPRSREAVSEMLSFVRDDRGRPAKSDGGRDDRVMARAIMWQMRKWHISYSPAVAEAGRILKQARRY